MEHGVNVRDIRWSNINFTVKALKKNILSDCWGKVFIIELKYSNVQIRPINYEKDTMIILRLRQVKSVLS